MRALFAIKAILAVAVGVVCALMAGCGAGSIPSLASGTVSSTPNPLVAIFTVREQCAGSAMVDFGETTNYGRSTAWYSANGYDQAISIEVAGMKASTTYHMRAQVQCGSATLTTPDKRFTTGPLPPSLILPQIAVTRPNPSLSSTENPGIEMLTISTQGYPALFTDRDGNVIWYYYLGPQAFPFPFKLLPNGNIVVVVTPGLEAPDTLREIDLAGNTIQQIFIPTLQQKMQAAGYDFVPTSFHHDVLPLANGHVLAIVNCIKSFTNLPGYPGTIDVVGDGIVDLDQNFNPVWAWNGFDWLDINRHLEGLPDWTHSNALLYSPNDGNLLLSVRHQSWVIKIDYNNGTGAGDILWRLGYQGDFALTAYGVPSDDPSQWFSFQHDPSLVSQSGTQDSIAVWDNGDNRLLNAETGEVCRYPVAGSIFPPCYSRATLFHVDENSMVADLSWADKQPDYSSFGGNINQFANGNVEFDLCDPAIQPAPGVASQIQEVTPTSNPQVVWQMDITPNNAFAYRGYRVPSLYPGVNWQY
jgi:arylsulfate sulfotransferase